MCMCVHMRVCACVSGLYAGRLLLRSLKGRCQPDKAFLRTEIFAEDCLQLAERDLHCVRSNAVYSMGFASHLESAGLNILVDKIRFEL